MSYESYDTPISLSNPERVSAAGWLNGRRKTYCARLDGVQAVSQGV